MKTKPESAAASSHRAAIYCRLSEEDKFKANSSDDSGSIANQKAMLTQYCRERDWTVHDIYSDDDFTGSDRNRPEFNRLLADAENGDFDIILCKTQSRFTRELELVERYINHLFPLWGIRFVSVVDNGDTSVKGNKKSRQINGLINEWYLEDMSENIKAVLTNRRKNGFFIGAFAPYGYKKDPERRGHLIIDEEAAVTVRLIFSLYLSGLGRSAIARELNSKHILTPTDYKLAHGERYKNNNSSADGHLWRYFTVANILTNETYIGNLVQNKSHSVSYKTKRVKPTPREEWIRAENTHEPIIDRKTWELAQQILNSKAKPAFAVSGQNIFSRKVFCSECGKTLRTSKNKDRRYLRCSTRYYAPDECIGVNIGYGRLYELVLGEIRSFIEQMADENKILSYTAIRDRSRETLVHYKNELEKAEAAVSDNASFLKNLYIDKVRGIIGEQRFSELSDAFSAEKHASEERIKRLREQIAKISREAERSESGTALVKRYIDCREMTFEMAQMFIEKIVVHPKRPYSREDNIDIYWNF